MHFVSRASLTPLSLRDVLPLHYGEEEFKEHFICLLGYAFFAIHGKVKILGSPALVILCLIIA